MTKVARHYLIDGATARRALPKGNGERSERREWPDDVPPGGGLGGRCRLD